ncbi:hypothetical protein AGDE_13144 [Angomonas deanei]|uniref:Uncharacterized protein n=1 Tax=Angomonas deanei TaxID=59799 RepID=A0A7G2C9X4_9TRYP|nr:hypothetical protein AGDE_13144 [Angomonas deanei]CAD2215563.1 hypothetical protein, conserved [Angomonas deanei]|eukprot:EPY22701.1 hypothetical protein AGDE_13144 [Angomonas deanei]
MHSPVSDSIDLNDLHFPAAKRRSGEWIEALQTSQSPSKHVVASPGEAFRPYTTPKSRVYETTVDESPIPITQDPTSFCKSSSSLQIAGDSPLLSSNANRSPYTESNTNSPLPRQDSAYSSTLMQALSMSEGAVVTTQVKSRKSRAQSVPSRTTSELYEDGMRAKLAKQQWVSLEQKRQQQLEEAKIKRDCSFSPSISRYAKNIRRPSSLHPQNRASAEVLRKRQWQALKAREQAERELEECTFRPLTLSTARLEQGAITAGPGVHNELYYEAQQRRHFNEVVKPRLVEEVDEAVRTKGGSNRVSPDGLEQIVSRLFSKVVSDKQAPPVVHSFQPQITEASKKIVREKVLLGERDPNIVEHLYTENDQKKPLDGQEDVEGCILESKRKIMKEVFKLKMEEDRDKLGWEYKTGLLVEKYRALSKRASVANGRVYYPDQPQSVLGLARAALDVLTPAEAEELLNVLDGYKQPHTVVGSFVNCVVDYVKEQTEADPEYCSPLLTVLPNSRKPRHVAPAKGKELPIVKREAADPELLQRAREKREEELRQYKASREAAEHEEYPFRPAPPTAYSLRLPPGRQRGGENHQVGAAKTGLGGDENARCPTAEHRDVCTKGLLKLVSLLIRQANHYYYF